MPNVSFTARSSIFSTWFSLVYIAKIAVFCNFLIHSILAKFISSLTHLELRKLNGVEKITLNCVIVYLLKGHVTRSRHCKRTSLEKVILQFICMPSNPFLHWSYHFDVYSWILQRNKRNARMLLGLEISMNFQEYICCEFGPSTKIYAEQIGHMRETK